jgi:hypothetical protein
MKQAHLAVPFPHRSYFYRSFPRQQESMPPPGNLKGWNFQNVTFLDVVYNPARFGCFAPLPWGG